MRTYILAVSFYGDYISSLISGIEKIKSFRKGNEVHSFLISNNPSNNEEIKNYCFSRNNVYFVSSDNESWEFSAWDDGIKKLISMNIDDEDEIICINDTFNRHRYFFDFHYQIFMQYDSSVFDLFIIGELCKANVNMDIDDMHYNSWISTYFYITNFRTIKMLYPLAKTSENELLNISNDVILLSDNIGKATVDYLSKWLFPKSGKRLWGRCSNKDKEISNDILVAKLKAILNEKRLSFLAQKRNVILCDVYNSLYRRVIRKILSFLKLL